MNVLLTGATGFIGSHTLAELVRSGHRVRPLVRSRDKLSRALRLHSLSEGDVEPMDGDATDETAVRRAADGCDALVHVAAVFSLDPNREAEMARVNPASTDLLLSEGRRRDFRAMVYVSTTGVFVPPPTDPVSGSGPLAEGCGPYTRSKVAAEKVARRHQADGAPIATVYPGAVLGPLDPNEGLSDSMAITRDLLRGRLPALPRPCPLPTIDVRDVAALIAAALQPDRGPRHYLFSGPTVDLRDVVARVNALTGRNLPCWPAPRFALSISGSLMDWVSLRTGRTLPFSAESVSMMLAGADHPDAVYDQTPARDDFGLPKIPLDATIRDTIGWLHRAGHITARQAGHLAA